MGILRDKFFGALSQAVFPDNFTCDICGREIFDGGRLCDKCKKTVEFNEGAVCPLCGRRTSYDFLCLECKAEAPLFDKARSAIVYDGGGKVLVQRFKNGSPYLKKYFAELMAEKCADFEGAECLLFVPMTARAKRRRGYNQSELLANSLSKLTHLPVIDAITKTKETPQQKSLFKRDREDNLKGCFKVDGEKIKGKRLILVDDVLTTGATANTLCALLKKHGADKVYFLSVASVEYVRQL